MKEAPTTTFAPVEAWGQGAHGHPPNSRGGKRENYRRSDSSNMDDKPAKAQGNKGDQGHLSARQKATLAAMQAAKQKTDSNKPKKGPNASRPATPGADSEGASRPNTAGSNHGENGRPKTPDTRPKTPERPKTPDRGSMWSRLSGSARKTKDFDEQSQGSENREDEREGGWVSYFRASSFVSRESEREVYAGGSRSTAVESSLGCGQEFTTNIIMSPKFDAFIGLVVVANSLTMALESEVKGDSGKLVLEIFDFIFLIVFTIELLMRAIALRWFLLQTFSDFLDIVIVLAGWIQVILMSVGSADDDVLQSFQALKVFRALRALRMLRMFVFFDGLWLAVSAFFHALLPLLWTCIFIAIILLIMSQFAVHLVGTSSEFEDLCLDFGVGCNTAYELFGTTVRSTTTLFQIMTLDEWRAVIQPINDRQWFTYVFFYFHICIASLALMNLVTAVVVENSMQRTLRNEEFQRIKKFQEAQEEEEEIRSLLDQIDMHGFDPHELVRVKDNWGTLKVMLDAMQLSSGEDMELLLKAADLNGDGAVSLAEFLDFCLLMRGLSGDAIRMAFFQIMAEGSDKWTAMDRILKKESAWISNSGVVARLEKHVQDCLIEKQTTPRGTVMQPTSPLSPVSESLTGSEVMVGPKKSTAEGMLAAKKSTATTMAEAKKSLAGMAEAKKSLAGGASGRGDQTVRSLAVGTKSTALKRQRPRTLFRQTTQKAKLLSQLGRLSKGSGGVSVQVNTRETITSDHDLLQELREIRSEMQAQTQEVDKQSTNLDSMRKSINDDIISKMPLESRVSVANMGPGQVEGLSQFISKSSQVRANNCGM